MYNIKLLIIMYKKRSKLFPKTKKGVIVLYTELRLYCLNYFDVLLKVTKNSSVTTASIYIILILDKEKWVKRVRES